MMNFVNWPFVTSSTSGGILDKAIEAEERMHGDFLRLVMLLSCSFMYAFHTLLDVTQIFS